jgi:hypothetical protein
MQVQISVDRREESAGLYVRHAKFSKLIKVYTAAHTILVSFCVCTHGLKALSFVAGSKFKQNHEK